MFSEDAEISRLGRADTLGLSYLRTIVTLNGGAILAVLTFIANSNADASIHFTLANVQASLWAFLTAISSMLVALLVSYSFTATAPEHSYHQLWNKWIVSFNAILSMVSLAGFITGVSLLILGAEAKS